MPEPALSPEQLLAQHAEALAELRAILKHQQQVPGRAVAPGCAT